MVSPLKDGNIVFCSMRVSYVLLVLCMTFYQSWLVVRVQKCHREFTTQKVHTFPDGKV